VEVHLKLAKLRRDTAEQEQPSLEPGSDTLGALNWRMAAPSSWMKSVTSPTCRSRFLRVLQERNFERVGGEQPICVDVRYRCHESEVENSDSGRELPRRPLLSAQLFPVEVPPLRERKDDILMLVEYFVQRYARQAGKDIRIIERNTAACSFPAAGIRRFDQRC
jgi:hypothetical protein